MTVLKPSPEELENDYSDYRHLPALSLMNPYAQWLITEGKDVENRTWKTKFRGQVLIHVSQGKLSRRDYDRALGFALGSNIFMPPPPKRGGIIGVVEIVDCVDHYDSPWFFGPWGFVIKNPRQLAFWPCKGSLGFFRPNLVLP
jgi:hypothetical protein